MNQMKETQVGVINVAIFAHNEEANIERCINSIAHSHLIDFCRLTVIINGCTDETEAIVDDLICYSDLNIKKMVLPLGDKSNAWNEFVYSQETIDGHYYFLDGDTWLPPFALEYLEESFDDTTTWAVATIPIGVKSKLRMFLFENKLISGSFYCLTSDFLKYVVNRQFKLPFGFIGDDSIISYIVHEGLNHCDSVKSVSVLIEIGAIIPREEFNFSYLKSKHARFKRYALRELQQEVFYFFARNNNLSDLPVHANDFKYYFHKVPWRRVFKWNGILTFYLPYALIQLFRGVI